MVFSGGDILSISLLAVKKIFTDSAYVLTYFHPRDFGETQQPVLPHLPLSRKFKSYVRSQNAESKLVKLGGV